MKINKTLLVIAATISFSTNANGLLGDAPKEGAVGKLDFGLVNTSGNSDTTSFNGSSNYTIRVSDAWATGFTVTGINNSSSDVRSAEKYTFAWNNNYTLTEKSFIYGTLDYVNDYFGAFDFQAGAYLGYGYNVFKDDSGHLSLGAAAGYRVNAAFIGEDEKESVLRGDLDYSYKISDSAIFTQKLTAIFGEEIDTYNSETAISSSISENLSLKVAYLITRNSVVPVGLKKTDSTTSIGVSYSF